MLDAQNEVEIYITRIMLNEQICIAIIAAPDVGGGYKILTVYLLSSYTS